MRNTVRRGRRIAAAGAIVALTAGGLLTATPATAAGGHAPGDTVPVRIEFLTSMASVNNPKIPEGTVITHVFTVDNGAVFAPGQDAVLTEYYLPGDGGGWTTSVVEALTLQNCVTDASATTLTCTAPISGWGVYRGIKLRWTPLIVVPSNAKTHTPYEVTHVSTSPYLGFDWGGTGTVWTDGPAFELHYPEGATYIKTTTTFGGVATPGAEVVFWDGGDEPAAVATADRYGKWSVDLTFAPGWVSLSIVSGEYAMGWGGMAGQDPPWLTNIPE